MIKFIKKLLGIKSPCTCPAEQAPYKIEVPTEIVITRVLAPESNPDVIVTPVTEGKKKANVKKPKASAKKPKAPPKPTPKKK